MIFIRCIKMRPISTEFEIWNDGAGMINYTLSETCDWVTVMPMEGSSTGEHDAITVTVNTTTLPFGSYHCDIAIDSDWGDATYGVDVDVVASGTPIVDVNQSVFDRGFPVRHTLDGNWGGAQNYTTTIDTVTSVDLYLRKMGTPEFDLTVELRQDGPQGTLLDTVVVPIANVPTSWTWLTIDVDNVTVGAGSDVFIVLPQAPSGVTTSFGYEWGYALGNQYNGGAFWFTRNGGVLWRDLPTMYEFCFKTYGFS